MTRARKLIVSARALCLMAIGGVGLSSASFTSQSANPSNTFTAATNFCTDTSLHSVTANRDTYVDQTSASTATGGTATTMNVQSRNSSRNGKANRSRAKPSCSTSSKASATRCNSFATPRW